ncbi:putative membrane protein [Flavobacteriaceae bacterium MAR_2009_75]|nr:putative membrane protein [Flavobacteriaceae bacterium MAR_2009_75]
MIVDQLILDKNASKKKFSEDKKSEKPIRSVAKAVSWRVIGTLDTLLISYLLTGEVAIAASIASIDFVTKMFLYFVHERVWNKITWGK